MAYIGKNPTAVPLTSSDITNGIITTAKIADDAISAAKLASGVGGKILQVVNTIKTDAFSVSLTDSNTANVTGLSVAITPSSSSNKILINAQFNSTNAGGAWQYFYISRGGAIGVGDQHGSNRKRRTTFISPFNSDTNDNGSLQILDAPSSTSELTYQLVISNGSGSTHTFKINQNDSSDITSRASFASTITAMEIAG